MNINDTQVGGSHYKARLQHWDYAVRALANRYLEGNITKYVVRYKKKNGTQDLEKAAHYLEKLILEFGHGTVQPMSEVKKLSFDIDRFMVENKLDGIQCRLVRLLANWRDGYDLAECRELLAQLLRASRAADAAHEATKAGARGAELADVHRAFVGAEPQSRGYVDQD